jgi:hypothetical protein
VSCGVLLGAFTGAVVSGVVPVVNAELLLIGLALAAPTSAAPALVLVVAAGQMVAKCALFLSGGRLAARSIGPRLARWKLDGPLRGRAAAPLVAASAAIGLPPFYLVAVAAPALGVRFRTFALVGLAGRVVRFAAVLVVPALISAFTH